MKTIIILITTILPLISLSQADTSYSKRQVDSLINELNSKISANQISNKAREYYLKARIMIEKAVLTYCGTIAGGVLTAENTEIMTPIMIAGTALSLIFTIRSRYFYRKAFREIIYKGIPNRTLMNTTKNSGGLIL